MAVNGKLASADDSSSFVIAHGATITQLALIFQKDTRTIKVRIADVPPAGNRGGTNYWRIRDVAPYIVKPIGDFKDALKNMNPDELPPNLRKEFWHALRQEQIYKREAGELWPTEDVLAEFSETFKEFRTELLLLGEAVEREVSLGDRAREILRVNIDTCMSNIRQRLIDRHSAPDPDAPPPEEDDMFAVPEEDEFDGL